MKTAILSHLGPDYPWADHLRCLGTVSSTNTLLRQLAASGAPQGTALIAEAQTGGRGRMGRSFHSPAGMGIYLSVLLRPDCPAGELMHLTCATAEAVCDGLERAGCPRPGIKWTNDLVLRRRKLGGILTELSIDGHGAVQWAILGVGINCCHRKEDFPPELQNTATSLFQETDTQPDRSRVAAELLRSLQKMSGTLLTGKSEMLRRYRKDCITLGQEISILRADTVSHGTALDIDDAGQLLVRYSDGTQGRVLSGEVSIRGMYGYL